MCESMASSIEDPSLSVTVLEALNQLIAAKPGEGGSDSQLIQRLLSNLAHTKRFLARHDGLEEKLLNVKKEYRLQLAPEGQWSFVTEVLSLLLILRVSLPAQESSHSADKVAPPGLLSVKQEQTIRGALQFLSLLGIYPYLSHGVEVSLQARTKSPVVLAKSDKSIMIRNYYLCQCVRVLVHLLTHQTLASFILSSVMRCDILASLIQIVHADSNSSSHDSNSNITPDQSEYKAMLSSFMTKIQPSLIVQDLLLLQRSSGKVRWFSSECGHMLSGLLIEENGLITVIRGIFGENIEGSNEASKVFWLKCQGVAKIVSSCPSQIPSVSSYYAIMCPQVLSLLKGEDRVCFVVACSVLSAMLSLHHDEAVCHLAIALVDPLLVLPIPGSLIALSQLSGGLKILHKIVSVCEPGSPFYLFLFEFSPIMFALSRGINKHETKLAESSVAKELLIKTIKSANMANQLTLFRHLMGIPLPNLQKQKTTNLKSIPESHDLVMVDNSSLALRESIKSTCSQRVTDLGASITELMLDSELTGGKLIGSMFIVIIKHLVSLLCSSLQINIKTLLPMDRANEDKGTSNVLLEMESHHSQSFSSTLVLYVAAALCENAGEKILTEVDNVTLVGSLVAIIKCHAINATRKLEVVRITEGNNVESLVGDHVTLSIAFGLLSAIMTANKEIPVKLRPLLSSMLPELETLSRNCDNSELATLAGELRICIATLGTVWTREGQTNNEPHNVTQTLEQTTHASHHKGSIPQNDRATVTPVPKCLEKIFNYLRDPLLPVQGHGLIELTRLIENRDTSVVRNFEFVLATLTDRLEHSDSYIYTGAIRGIVAAAFIDSSKVISLLCDYYTGFKLGRRPVVNDKGLHVGSSDTTTSDSSDCEFEKVMKVGEALVKIVDGLGDTLPFYANRLISAFMINTRHADHLIRASALSNLAELCGHMKFTFTGVENEVLSLLSNVIHFDISNEVKRAAITVIKKIFESFQDQKSSVEELQPHVSQLYRLLKHVCENDSDPITRTSAQAALGGLDTIMRQYLFPTHTEKIITILP